MRCFFLFFDFFFFAFWRQKENPEKHLQPTNDQGSRITRFRRNDPPAMVTGLADLAFGASANQRADRSF